MAMPVDGDAWVMSESMIAVVVCSDHLTLLNVYHAWLDNNSSNQWCRRNYIDARALSRHHTLPQGKGSPG